MTPEQQSYIQGSKNSRFRIGQKVKVTRRAADTYERGWINSWMYPMTDYINCIGTIKYIDHKAGIGIDFNDKRRIFSFPYFILQNEGFSFKIINDF